MAGWGEFLGEIGQDATKQYVGAYVGSKVSKLNAPKEPRVKKVTAEPSMSGSYADRIPVWGWFFVGLLVVAVVYKLIKG